MPNSLRTLLAPLNLAGLLTWLAVVLALRAESEAGPAHWVLLILFLAGLFACSLVPAQRARATAALLAMMAGCALTLVWLAPRGGTAPVLLVVLMAMLAARYSPRILLLLALLINAALYVVLRQAHNGAPGIVTLIYAGFQSFAALTAHYARSAEASRDLLARVNADLLATRALLADSARDAERLRVARELHDVAGHKLTAMRLNLRAMAADPAFAQRSEVALAERLSGELLDDLRSVVQALRDARGLDLRTALLALAAPLPKPQLRLAIGDDVHITDSVVAETILRLVQEALTNSARHADADIVHVALHRYGDRLRLRIEDDGRARDALREGNGIAGMRERIAALGGRFAIDRNPQGALRIDAELPG